MSQNPADKASTVVEKQNLEKQTNEAPGVEERVFHSPKQVAHQPFEFVLPVKITGVVFWGLALVGLIIAVFLLQGKEEALQEIYQRNVILFADQLEKDLPKVFFPDAAEQEVTQSEQAMINMTIGAEIKLFLDNEFPYYQKQYHFNSFTLKFDAYNLQFGQAEAEDVSFQTVVTSISSADNGMANYHLTIHYPNLTETVIAERKNLLLSIGAVVFLFGLLLQKVLQYILNKPFLKLLNSAQQFARGDTTARFDESTSDEFGFLSKFINEALDSIVQQQREVYRALSRAKKSELALFKEKELAEVTLHSITDGVITTDSKAMINYMNPVAERLLGWNKEEVNGLFIADIFALIDETSNENIKNPLVELLKYNQSSKKITKGNTALKHRTGELLSIELSIAPMKNQENNIIGGVVVFQDVSDARRMTSQLSFQAKHDALTGLFNRRVFEDRLEKIIEDAKINDRNHVLCYLDLDQFKVVNDTCGHMAGDELLRQLSIELSNSIRDSDLLARLGGDEFGVILENCQLEQAEGIANTLRENIKNYRFIWDARIFEVGVSVGVVAINKNSENISGILSAADLACYAAKDSGRNRIHVYQPTDEELNKRHSEMHCVTRINYAMEEDLFFIYKQPIVSLVSDDANSESTMHWEVLLRMENIQGEIVSPDDFISAAERYNLMPKIDRMVIQKTFRAMSEGQFYQKNYDKRIVGINLSGASVTDDSFLVYIKEQAEIYNIDFKEVCLEITETVAIANLAKATYFMQELKNLGCQFALDDFGSGLSSFGYLKYLQVDYLKIDGTFVKDMCADKIDRALVESINQVGHIMEMKTIAEWVEDESTLNLLKEIGVDYSQGYFTGKPTPLM